MVTRVLVVATSVPAQGGGGIARYIHGLVKGLALLPDVELAVLVRADAVKRFELHVPRAQVIAVRRTLPFGTDDLIAEVRGSVRRFGPDVVVYAKHFVSAYAHTKQVLVLHDMLLFDRPQDYPLRKRLFRSLYVRSIRKAGRLVAVSEFTRGRVSERISTLEQIHVVTESLPLDFAAASDSDPVSPQEPEQRHRAAKDLRLLFVGDPIGRKALPFAVRVCSELERRGWCVQLSHVGPSPQLRQGSDEHSPTPAFLVPLGYVHDAQLVSLYRSVDALLLPSIYEGFGLPLLEAASQACPTVSSRAPALLEAALPDDAVVRFCAPDEVKWADAVEELQRTGLPQQGLVTRCEREWADIARRVIGLPWPTDTGCREFRAGE